MSVARIVTTVCDHCGGNKNVETVTVNMGGERYRFDLCDKARGLILEWGAQPPPKVGRPRKTTPRPVLELDDDGEPIIPQ